MQGNPDQIVGIIAAVIAFYAVVILVALVAIIVPFWFILKKVGFSPWLSLFNMVPLGTLILLYVLAFAEWKVVPASTPTWMPPNAPPPQG